MMIAMREITGADVRYAIYPHLFMQKVLIVAWLGCVIAWLRTAVKYQRAYRDYQVSHGEPYRSPLEANKVNRVALHGARRFGELFDRLCERALKAKVFVGLFGRVGGEKGEKLGHVGQGVGNPANGGSGTGLANGSNGGGVVGDHEIDLTKTPAVGKEEPLWLRPPRVVLSDKKLIQTKEKRRG